MSTYFWHDESKGWTYTAAGRSYSTYAECAAAYLAGVAVHPSSGDVFKDLDVDRPEGLDDEDEDRAKIAELAEELGVENKTSTVFRAALAVAKGAVATHMPSRARLREMIEAAPDLEIEAGVLHPEAPTTESLKSSPTLEMRAQAAYDRHTDNHPTIHSNRFPSWEELSDKSKQGWRDQVEEAEHEEQVLAQPLRKNGVPIEGALAFKEGHPVESCPYSSTSSQDYEAHTRWTDEWSRAAMDDNNETDNEGTVLPV